MKGESGILLHERDVGAWRGRRKTLSTLRCGFVMKKNVKGQKKRRNKLERRGERREFAVEKVAGEITMLQMGEKWRKEGVYH